MPNQEHLRELVMGALDPERLRERTEAGWKLVAIEWEREAAEASSRGGNGFVEEVPYGMQVANDCLHLVENPTERAALVSMMDLIVQDHPLSYVARELNLKGFRTREGQPWNQVAVFNMLPRLVDVGPKIFSSGEWEARRKRVMAAGH
ncbi:MAG TPA: recombinase family protein [Terriglobia bacterium]|nr:recombinase family protein [Terriglobia bacterium]